MSISSDNQIRLIVTTIKRRREEIGYSQQFVANRMNISQNGYSRIELGHTKITADQLLSIFEILGMDLRKMLSK